MEPDLPRLDVHLVRASGLEPAVVDGAVSAGWRRAINR
jgi:hypothetical protein